MLLLWDEIVWDGSTVKILKLLNENGRRFSDFLGERIPRTTLDRRLRQLGRMGLIEMKKDFDTGIKKYYLTDLGRKVLQKLIELEQIYEEEMKKAPPKGEKFLEG
ncbi:MAG: winged helix-turn-helix domain-containing protein [Archaeoglobaceae archaeon]